MRALAAALLALAIVGCGAGVAEHTHTHVMHLSLPPTVATATTARTRAHPPAPHPPFAAAQRAVTFVDHSRFVTYPGEAPQPRRLVTIVRYPLAPGRFPLVVFGHGFAVTPAPYARLLEAWAQAGYVVAAPLFPLENADAPGGPNEADLVNQPRDMSFVITRMLALDHGTQRPFAGLINPSEIAVAGQSDGGDTALTVAYDGPFRDRRIRAAVILSGQEMPGVGGYDFPPPSPPLLATQGLADTINVPSTTFAFWDAAPPPKFLLTMPGTPHLPPYTYEQPQLGIVERVSIAFLDLYLKGERGALSTMIAGGDVPGRASLRADPG